MSLPIAIHLKKISGVAYRKWHFFIATNKKFRGENLAKRSLNWNENKLKRFLGEGRDRRASCRERV